VILTGIRIVLVQNISLATIAADRRRRLRRVHVPGRRPNGDGLVLLGAVPTAAFAAAIILDAVIEMTATSAG
jgi:osmoprotectant transport system permease protein